jgi:hypothetical protein
MRRIVAAILLTAWADLAQEVGRSAPQSDTQTSPQDASTVQKSTITVPAGTKVSLALTRPIWAKTVQAGDSVYSATAFPITIGNDMAIPPGTYVEGKIDTLKRPGWLSRHAEFQIHFTKFIFANGYTVDLSDVLADSSGANQALSSNSAAAQPAPSASAAALDIETAVARVYVDVTSQNDVLLDIGAPIEMLLQSPLSLEARSVAAAVRRSRPLQITQSKSSTRCVPTPGTPGTSDTVIPGTPGTSGTPDTVIPGAPGMPPTVIPGIPATPGTPATVIPGTPGTSGTACPAPPAVISQAIEQEVHTKTVTLTSPMQVGGTQVPAGKYQIRWTGLGPLARVEILQNKKAVAQAASRVVILARKSAADAAVPRTNPDGTVSLGSLQFAAEAFALFFD